MSDVPFSRPKMTKRYRVLVGVVACGLLVAIAWVTLRSKDSGVVGVSSLKSVPLMSGPVQDLPSDNVQYRVVRYHGYEQLYAAGRATKEGVNELGKRLPSLSFQQTSWDRMPGVLHEVHRLISGSSDCPQEWSRECWFLTGHPTPQSDLYLGFDPQSGHFWLRMQVRHRG